MKVINKHFFREYKEIESYEAGMSLTGGEVKSINEGRIRLDEAFVKVVNSEVFLINADILPYKFARPQDVTQKRTIKLLLHKKEILRLETKLHTGNLTIVPVSCYNKKNTIKLQIALAQGRKTWEIKKVEKERDVKRDTARELREYKNKTYK